MTARAEATLSSLERAVLEAVAYADVFDFPVTPEEIRRVLPVLVTVDQVETALRSLPGRVVAVDGLYLLAGREPLVETRRARGEASRKLMRTAVRYGSLIAKLPFVRMVGITGSLAVENAEPDDDIDYLIVTAKGRLWLTRALTVLLVRLAALRGVTLCPNYLLTESALALLERDRYTARELLQMKPLSGRDVYERMMAENAWCRELLPNWEVPEAPPERGRSLFARLGEAMLGGRLGDALERRIRRRKVTELRAQAGDNAEAVFAADICKGHFDAHRTRLNDALEERLEDVS